MASTHFLSHLSQCYSPSMTKHLPSAPWSSSASKVGDKQDCPQPFVLLWVFYRPHPPPAAADYGLFAHLAYTETSSTFWERPECELGVSAIAGAFTTSHRELGPAPQGRRCGVGPSWRCRLLLSPLINQTFQWSPDSTLPRPSPRSQTPSPQTFTLRC